MATIRMPEHQPEQHGDIGEDYNIATLATSAVVGLLILLLTVMWLKAIYLRADRWEWERKVVTAPFSERDQLRSAQEAKLVSYEWTDPAQDKVGVPVAEVQDQVLAALQAGQRQDAPPPAAETAAANGAAAMSSEEAEYTRAQVADIEAQAAHPPRAATDFAFVPFSGGGEQHLSRRLGKPLVVNFWAVWCGPCRLEMPDFESAYTARKGQFDILGVCVDDRQDPPAFVKSQGFSWTFAYDRTGGNAYQIDVIPRTLFINADGAVVVDVKGYLTHQGLQTALSKIL